MSEWREVSLGDALNIAHGWPFVGELCSEELTGKPIIVSIGNFRYTGGFNRERFMPWRTIEGETVAPATMPQLEVLLRGCSTSVGFSIWSGISSCSRTMAQR